jgi:hypothetical protein
VIGFSNLIQFQWYSAIEIRQALSDKERYTWDFAMNYIDDKGTFFKK